MYSNNNLFSIAIPKEMVTTMQAENYYAGASVISAYGQIAVTDEIRLNCEAGYDWGYINEADILFFVIPNEEKETLTTFCDTAIEELGLVSDYYSLTSIAYNKTHTAYCAFIKQSGFSWDRCHPGNPCVEEKPDKNHQLLHLLWENIDVMKKSFRWEF